MRIEFEVRLKLKERTAYADARFDVADALFRIQEKRIAVIRERLKKHGILL